jgi:phospholipid transport system substrate-binding protein
MISRRNFLQLFAVSLSPIGLATSALAADHPSVTFMKKVGKDLLNANRQGTVRTFLSAIQNHADVANIADYSLGRYRSKLSSGQKGRYYQGTATFMARYFAEQSREFEVAKYEVGEATVEDNKDITVESKITLLDGKSYNVDWKVAWRGGRYKVIDVKVLGFSLTYMQRNIFTDFVGKRKGDVGELITALNR